MTALFEFKAQDLWVGVFWKSGRVGPYRTLDVWICFLPMLPLHLSWEWEPV